MGLYKYQGYKEDGKVIEGVLEAPDLKTAKSSVKAKQILPKSIELAKGRKRFDFSKKPDIGYLFFQLGMMLKCGLPLTRSLDVVSKQIGNRRLTSVLDEIKKDITEGVRFSNALNKYPKYFPEIYINMVRIAEATGGIADLLMSIAGYEEKKKTRENKVKSDLAYPIAVLLIGSGIVGFLLVYVVPKMVQIFHSVKAKLPLSTKILIALGNFFRDYGVISIILIVLIYFLFKRFYRKGLKEKLDRFLMRFEPYRKSIIARFTEILAFQLQEGIPVVLALRSSKGIVKNLIFQKEVERISDEIERGKSFSEAIRRSKIFDDMFKAAIITGENTGELTDLLKKISHYMYRDVEKVMDRLSSLAEPAIVMFLGLIVGFIVLSIMLPIFDLDKLVR